MAQDDIDCNYKVVTFLQNILIEIKLTSCTKKFPSINGSWQSAHTKQVGCHWRSKNIKIFYSMLLFELNWYGNVLNIKLGIHTERGNIIVDDWSGTSTAAGCKRFSMAFHAKCFSIVFLIPIILNTSRYNIKLSCLSNIIFPTQELFYCKYKFYLPQKGCYS